MPTSIQLTRAVLGLAGFGGVVFAVLIVPALALHFLFSFYAIVRGQPAEPAAVSGDPLHLALALLSWISFRGMRAEKMRKWAYYTGSVCLGYWTLTAMTSTALTVTLPGLTPEQARALGQALGLLVMGGLFCRFTFGRPSRTYFRVARS